MASRARHWALPGCLGQVEIGAGQVIPDNYLPEGHVEFSAKFSKIIILVSNVMCRAGKFDVRASMTETSAQGQPT